MRLPRLIYNLISTEVFRTPAAYGSTRLSTYRAARRIEQQVVMKEPRLSFYATISFAAGVLFGLNFKNIYLNIERKYRGHLKEQRSAANSLSLRDNHINLHDHEEQSQKPRDRVEIQEGVESCVGNTRLLRIKSLSDATGCEILAKAEVFDRSCE